jgi:hypothetical protein
MNGLLRLGATIAIVSSLLPLRRIPVVLRGTALAEAGRWGIAAIALWIATELATEVLPLARDGLADQLWLAVAVLALSPFVAALGARRPGSRAWNWFVVLPMTIVLFLPATTAWGDDLHPEALRLETPMLAGYFLVLAMGTGNYCGTRFGFAAFLVALACAIVILPMSALGERFLPNRNLARSGGAILLSFAAWHAAGRTRRLRVPQGLPFDAVWIDFRDYFGIVWASRVLNRFNESATSGGWNVRLHLLGFAVSPTGERRDLSPIEAEQIDHTLRWLLRRFVDPEWIDARLAQRPTS